MLDRTRLSLYYLATYLWLGGVALLVAPNTAATWLLSNGNYAPVMLRSLGMFLVGLGIIVIQIIRLRLEALYPTTLLARLFFCSCLAAFFATTRDPFFIVLFGIVALGLVLTGATYWRERERERPPAA